MEEWHIYNEVCLFAAIPNGFGTSPLTPSARISALNIVGDLLRKVGVSAVYWTVPRSVPSLRVHPHGGWRGLGSCWISAGVSKVSLLNCPHLVFGMWQRLFFNYLDSWSGLLRIWCQLLEIKSVFGVKTFLVHGGWVLADARSCFMWKQDSAEPQP